MPQDPNCPACCGRRLHTDTEWGLRHPQQQKDIDWSIPVKGVEPTTKENKHEHGDT